MSDPLVSICCITYNHANYIKECLEGFILQQCNFPFEILIHDDASTDGTQDIIKEYQEKYPKIIKPILQVENQYSKGVRGMNPKFNFPRAKGKYIALCEGDDYWTDPKKLQKQFNILEKNPDINICSHPSYKIIDEKLTDQLIGYWGKNVRYFSFEEVLFNFATTAPLQTMFFRKKDFTIYNELVSKALAGHSMTQIYFSYDKGLVYLPDVMSTYRIASSSSISKILFKNDKGYLKRQLKNIDALNFLEKNVNQKYSKAFDNSKSMQAMVYVKSSNTDFFQIVELIFQYSLYKRPGLLIKSIMLAYNIKTKRFVKNILGR